MAKKGIDVSYCQGNINFSQLDKNQVQFAVIRSSFGWEANQKDSKFEQNYSGFKKLGIPVGAYHYSYAKTKEQAVMEANYCLECIKGKSFELPVFIDMEEQSCAAAGRRACTDVAKAFIETIEKAGYSSGIYTNPNWLENYFYKDELIGKVNLWLAQWGSSKPYCDCMLWQYNVGKAGSVKGISGDIDLDYCMTEFRNSKSKVSVTVISDRDKFIETARSYIGKNGAYVCKTKLGLNYIVDWCAYAVSAIMKDCGFIGKYQGGIYSYASDNARNDNGKYGTWFLKGNKTPQAGDLIMFKYASFTNPIDEYSASHIGIVENVNGNTITTLEGNVDGNNDNWAETSSFKRKTRYLSSSDVYSFFRPNWKNTTTSTSASSTNSTKTNKTNSQVTELGSSSTVNYSVKVTSNNGINIRADASTTKAILGAVPYNTTLKVIKQTGGSGYTWGLITYNGITGWIALEFTKKIETVVTFKKGDKVKVKNSAVVYGTNQKFSSFVYQTTYQIMEISGNRIVIGINGQVMSAIDKKYLIKV